MQKSKGFLFSNCSAHQMELLDSSKVRPGFEGLMCRAKNCWYGIFTNGDIKLCASCFPGFTSDVLCDFECLDPSNCDCKKCKLPIEP